MLGGTYPGRAMLRTSAESSTTIERLMTVSQLDNCTIGDIYRLQCGKHEAHIAILVVIRIVRVK